jgi:hypothetical protein
MPIQIRAMNPEELQAIFSRRARGAENVDDYVDALEANKVGIGTGLSLKTQIVTPDEGDSYTILEGSVDEEDPAGVTVRAAKRRFNLAARELGYALDWREIEGWIILRGKAEEPVTDGKVE